MYPKWSENRQCAKPKQEHLITQVHRYGKMNPITLNLIFGLSAVFSMNL